MTVIKGQKLFVDLLEKNNELIRIKEYVNPELEITEITDRISKQVGGGKALLFENTGTSYPLLINAFGSEKRICLALGIDNLDEIGLRLNQLLKDFNPLNLSLLEKLKTITKIKEVSNWIPKKKSGKGICQEVINKSPDLNLLPVLKCWPYDGGKFITLPIVHTVNPIKPIRNIGMYRMQLFTGNKTGMHWHRHKGGAHHYNEYKILNKVMPVSVVLGGDPVYTYAATAPLPDNIDEYIFAGFLKNKQVELVKCITNDLYVPQDADFVIEGYINPNENLIKEGPFGDHTGFYSLEDLYPLFHVTCITHKKDAIYPATIVGIPPQEDAYIAKATERIFLTPIKISISPEIIDMKLPVEGVAHNLAIVKINKKYPGHALKVANTLWGAGQMMFNKVMIIVDQNCNINNSDKLINSILLNAKSERDYHITKGPLDVLDHSSKTNSYGGKICIDATAKLPEEEYTNINYHQYSDIDPVAKSVNNNSVVFNDSIFLNNLPILIIGIDENNINLNQLLLNTKLNAYINKNPIHLILIDKDFPINNIHLVIWFVLGNIDPEFDIYFRTVNGRKYIIYDGTSKYMNNLNKNWPNIIVSDKLTIKKVDEIWENLKIGPFIKSPSINIQKLIKTQGAAIKK